MSSDPRRLRWLAAALVLWAAPAMAATPAKGAAPKAKKKDGPIHGKSVPKVAPFIPAGITVTTTGNATARLGLGLAFPAPAGSPLVFATTLEAAVRTDGGVASLVAVDTQGKVTGANWSLALSGQAWLRHGKDSGPSILPVAYLVAGVGVGRQTFSYLETGPTSVVTAHDGVVHVPVRAGALGYWIVNSGIPDLALSIAGRIGYVRSWTASPDTARVCTGLGVVSGGQGNVSACRDEVLGPPSETSGLQVEVQVGPVVEMSDRLARAALDLALAPDASGENLSLGVPVYLAGHFLGHYGTIALMPHFVLPLSGTGRRWAFALTLDVFAGDQALPTSFDAGL